MIDQPTRIRSGEELPVDQLTEYFKSQGIDLAGPLEIEQFPSGYSNLTYFLKSGEKEWVLRRPPFGAKIKSAHDMGREFNVLSMLMPVFPYVPAPVAYCEDEEVLGAPFYIMERVRGLILRNKAPESFTASTWKSLSERVVDQLAEMHGLDLSSTGLDQLGKPEGYARRQVEGWIKRYHNAKTDEIASMDEVEGFMMAHIPDDVPPAMIHNDYKYDNIVLDPDDPTKILAILDWEMATIGDPAMDLATSLAYWSEPSDHPALRPFNLTWIEGNLDREEVVNRYMEKSGREIHNMVFYYAYACYKLGVICQQIYARYKLGYTKDPRFAMLIEVVKACGENARRAIEKDRISKLYP